MTTLAERAEIEANSQGDPASVDPAVQAAIVLLARIRSGVIDVAQSQLATPAPDPETVAWREAIAWARDAVMVPDNWSRIVLRLLLAKFDALTPAQLADVAVVTDEAVIDEIEALVPTLALGRDVRRS